MTDIIVIGKRISDQFWGFGFNEVGAYDMNPFLSPEPGGHSDWQNDLFEPHNQVCATPQDAAKSIAQTIMSTTGAGSPNNWQKYEYGAVISIAGNNEFGAFNRKVYTDWQPGWANLGAPPSDPGEISGIIHNHPGGINDINTALVNRYPSLEDLDRFGQLVDDGKFYSSASIFILDRFGAVREFPYSTHASIRQMHADKSQMIAGVGLPPEITTQNCRSVGP